MIGFLAAYPLPSDEKVMVTTEVYARDRQRARKVVQIMLAALDCLPSRPQG